MNGRTVMEIVCGAALLLTGFGGGCACAHIGRDAGIQEVLGDARKKLEANYTGAQSEMTIVSEFQLELAQMELYHVRYTVWNREDYAEIEAAFRRDEQAWEKKLKAEQQKPSEFEGGSLAPMDHNLRMTGFVERRIAELREKWVRK